MSEYTSLEVSKQLADAGFQREGGEMYWGSGVNLRYRSDTLLTWLLSLDVKEVTEKMGVRTLAENGDRGCLRIEQIRIDFKGTVAYVVQLHRPIEAGSQAATLADALGQLVCEVMKVMA